MSSSRVRLFLAGCALVLLTFGALIWLNVGSDENSSSVALDSTGLSELPARPEDIEAHGNLARSTLETEQARQRNAAVAFSPGPLSIARPFDFKGSEIDRARAIECLATAVLYEAGDDTTGQAAVAQVVLNRVRHAAFPNTVCGVVYQGAERSTGCQFTFTCDGSLRRKMSDAAWGRAREVAKRALAGAVDKSVGLATHYHTDWVYPYWSPELSKLARVGTHLFFGWPGSWGGPYAFRRKYLGNEGGTYASVAAEPETAKPLDDPDLGPPKILGLPQPPAKLPPEMRKVPLYGNRLRLVGHDGRTFGLVAPPGALSSNVVNAALALCARPGPCQVNAWSHEDDVPGEYPIPSGARGTMVFEYVREGSAQGALLRFDCERFPNKNPSLCLKDSAPELASLPGVRWKTD